MTQPQITFVGAGNMARAMIGGLRSKDWPGTAIHACDIDSDKLADLANEFGINTSTDANSSIAQSEVVILAVKPQVMQSVCRSITATEHHPLFISIAAGLREQDINQWLGGGHAMVRCMPNTPALLSLGASGLFANERVNPDQRALAESILQSTGITAWVEQESKLDAVTAISGSGPAYFFLFIEALQQAAQQLGLDQETAFKLSRQTALGAATMALNDNVAELRRQVTSPGGTTERAIESFNHDELAAVVMRATQAACDRAEELAEQLAKG